MNLTYKKINERLLEYFLEHKTFFGQIVLTIDRREFENLFLDTSVESVLNCIHEYWEKVASLQPLEQKLAYGIIALQGIAVYEHSVTGYKAIREELEKILQISSPSLTALFEGGVRKRDKTFQDQLWYGAKNHLEMDFHLEMMLPPSKRYAHRFVQYPASQALLSSYELQYFTKIFIQAGLFPGIQITLEDFRERIFYKWKEYGEYLPHRVKQIFEKNPEKADLFCRQLYQYFCDWDGTEFKYKDGKVIKYSRAHFRLVAEYVDGHYEFSLHDAFTDEYATINPNDYFKSFPKNRAFGLLQLDSGYTNVYSEQTVAVQQDRPLLLIFRLDFSSDDPRYFDYRRITIEKKKHCREIIKNVFICRFEQLTDLSQIVDLKIKTIPPSPVTLCYGLKVGFQIYLQGAGPKIMVNDDSLNFSLHRVGASPIDLEEYDPEQAAPGKYIIMVPDHPQISFNIVPLEKVDRSPIVDNGWAYSSWSIQDADFDVAGCLFQDKTFDQKKNLTREWIETQTRADYVSPSGMPLLQAINQSKYGNR